MKMARTRKSQMFAYFFDAFVFLLQKLFRMVHTQVQKILVRGKAGPLSEGSDEMEFASSSDGAECIY